MRTIALSAFFLLLGLFLGGLAPRAELRAARKEIAEAREAAERARRSSATPLALGVRSLLEAGRRTPPPGPERGAGGAGAASGAAAPRTADDEAGGWEEDDDDDGQDGAGGRRRRAFPFEDDKALDAAKAAADVRAAQFRAAFLEQARLGHDGEARVGRVIDEMNAELKRAADAFAPKLDAAGKDMRLRAYVDLSVEMLGAYQRADERLAGLLDPTAIAARDKTRFDLLTQIDLDAFRALARVAQARLGDESGP